MPGFRFSPSDRQRAFTLIELLTVVAIIGVLSAIVIGVGRRASGAGKEARTRAELASLAAALESYRQHYGSYPLVAADAGGSSTVSGRALFAALNGWRGPALAGANFASRRRVFLTSASLTPADPTATETATNHFVDPWGNPYHYAYSTSANGWKNSSFVLFSAGPDGLAVAVAETGFIDTASTDNVDNLYANQ